MGGLAYFLVRLEVQEMGYQRREYVIAKCDYCDAIFETSDGGQQCFTGEKEAKHTIEGCDWRMKNGKLQCADCWEN